MKWQPWIDFDDGEVEILPISEPPCKECSRWLPQRVYKLMGDSIKFDGVELCHAPEMYPDYSCYRAKVVSDG